MSALVKNGDLTPDPAGMITKQQTFDALLHVGISRKVATETTDANFDHLLDDPKSMNVFRMNTVNTGSDGPDPPGPLEHFRSTGIRDGGNDPKPNENRYGHFGACAAFDNMSDTFSRVDIRDCATLVWDHERFGGFPQFPPAILPSNDINKHKRPTTCGELDSGFELCPSQLHGSIIFLHEEFGTPTGENAKMPVA